MQYELELPLNFKQGDTILLKYPEVIVTQPPAPKEPWDRKTSHLTLPVNDTGALNGIAYQVEPEEFLTYTSEWFKIEQGKYIFSCPDGGATTSSRTRFARCEARHRTDFSRETSTNICMKLSVDEITLKGIILQIHGGSLGNSDKPWFKVTAEKQSDNKIKIYARTRFSDRKERNLDLGVVDLKEIFTLRISYNSEQKTLSFQFNEGNVVVANNIYTSSRYYWKYGAYFQNTERKGNRMTVTHYEGCILP